MTLVIAASMACDEVSTGGAPITAEKVVTVQNNYFDPAAVTVHAGNSVLWVWPGSVHNIAFFDPDAPGGCGNLVVGDCQRTFNTIGTYSYTCTLHAGMDGQVNVVAP
jgi:plastocyanin